MNPFLKHGYYFLINDQFIISFYFIINLLFLR